MTDTTETEISPAPANLAARILDRLDMRWWEAAIYAALILAGLGMRLWELGARAMHHDESLHSFYSWELANGAAYVHNPMMHGPLQFEANAAIFVLLGDSEFTARLLYAVMGTVLIALPMLLRSRLGRYGALAVSALLVVSPTILYFSRFARNDILMAVWALGLVICMWRYFDEGKNRYLYISSALLALTFATKESAYLLVGTLGLWCVLVLARAHFKNVSERDSGRDARRDAGRRESRRERRRDRRAAARGTRQAGTQGVSPPVAIARGINKLLGAGADFKLDLTNLAGPAGFLVFLITLTLPQWSAFSALFQDTLLGWTNLTLAAPEGSPKIGDPIAGGNLIAFVVIAALGSASLYFGYLWNWSVWWRCAAIFYPLWALLYTTFFTNYGGIKSGIWQSLGYWVVQQGEGRGGQPWYYYFVVTSVYEFLPIIIGAIAAVYYLRRRRDAFDVFLVYWALITLLLFTIASEKMPWLVVGITLPFVVLSGKFLADVARRVDWRASLRMRGYGYALIPGVPLFLILLWNLAIYRSSGNVGADLGIQAALAVGVGLLIALLVYASRSAGRFNALGVSLIVLAVVLAALSVRAGAIASYRNGDTPVEMLVYTQTSPDVTRLLDALDQSEDGMDTPIAIDSTSGFSWPWAWYFRSAPSSTFPSYNENSFDAEPYESALLVHSSNRESADEMLPDTFSDAERVRHRWWFPEHVYRDMTPTKFAAKLFDRSAWRNAAAYWLNREGVMEQIGSEDSYLYFREGAPLEYEGAGGP